MEARKKNGCLVGVVTSIVAGLLLALLLIATDSSDDNVPSPYENCIDETTKIFISRGEYDWDTDAEVEEWCRDNFPESAP